MSQYGSPFAAAHARRLLLAAAALVAASPLVAQASAKEYELKAAFLANFAKFVEWPTTVDRRSFVIGVLGGDPSSGAFEKLAGKQVRGVPIAFKIFSEPSKIVDCDLLFVPKDESSKLAETMEVLRGKSALIVGESTDFAAAGASVNFFVEDKKLRFEINAEAAAEASLKISSQLLKLARLVKPTTPPAGSDSKRAPAPPSRPHGGAPRTASFAILAGKLA